MKFTTMERAEISILVMNKLSQLRKASVDGDVVGTEFLQHALKEERELLISISKKLGEVEYECMAKSGRS